MTYSTGGPIQATDYNTFSTLTTSMNEVFADTHSNATSIASGADYGYGQTPALSSVAVGNAVTAVQWSALYDTMRNSGAHQGTTVVPPLPATNPVSGNTIVAYAGVDTLVNTLRTNRFYLAPGQSTLITGTTYASSSPWTNTLSWSYSVDFSTWNNARYFFNSGGQLRLSGFYSPVVLPEDTQWNAMLTAMSPLSFGAISTTPNSGVGTSVGFYGLDPAALVWSTVYQATYGGVGYYANSYITVQAKLANAAGINGIVNFVITLVDADVSPTIKSTTTTYRVDTLRASGLNVSYPGPTVTLANNGFVST